MKSITRLILNFVTLMLIVVGAPAYLGAADATGAAEWCAWQNDWGDV